MVVTRGGLTIISVRDVGAGAEPYGKHGDYITVERRSADLDPMDLSLSRSCFISSDGANVILSMPNCYRYR